MSSKLLPSYLPFKVKLHFNSKTNKFDLVIDGSDFEFYLVTGNVSYDAAGKKVLISKIDHQVYYKSNILYRATFRITKDFIVCSSYS